MVGSLTRPVMPHLVMLWKMGPLRGEGRAGARLWTRGPSRRTRGAIGSKSQPGVAGWPTGPLRGQARRLASGYLLSTHRSAFDTFSRLLQRQLSRVVVLAPLGGFVGRQTGCWWTS